MVMEVVHEDMGDGYMHCVNHRYKNSTPGGICAFCLQEKLGKLVSSSFPVAVFPSSSSSSTPRSDYLATSSLSSQSVDGGAYRGVDCSYSGHHVSRSRLPFYLPHLTKKKKDSRAIVLNRSKSTTAPRRCVDEAYAEDLSPRKRRLWSFFYSSKHGNGKAYEHQSKDLNLSSATLSTVGSSSNEGSLRPVLDKKKEDFSGMDVNGSPDEASFDRKVSRSRSVGCGSKSFSGDFFERISTGFGDCTLRRVESQREGKPKTPSVHGHGVKCVGIFGGFMVPSSSSSASAEENNVNGKSFHGAHLSYGKFKSWGLTLASPITH